MYECQCGEFGCGNWGLKSHAQIKLVQGRMG